jgi:hypothetical protein
MAHDPHGEPPITVTSSTASSDRADAVATTVATRRRDAWDDVVLDHDLGERHHDVDRSSDDRVRHRSPWLLPTHGARLVVTSAWAGLVVADVLLLSALMPGFRRGDTSGYRVDLGDHDLLRGTLTGSAVLLLFGWTWWSMSAALNARKLSPMAPTPLLPAVAYLGGPFVFMFGSGRTDADRTTFAIAAVAMLLVGHQTVVLAFKGCAERIRASVSDFQQVFWLPLAWVSYRLVVAAFVDSLDPAWRTIGVLVAIGAIEVAFASMTMVATWRAMTSFDAACHRLATRSLGNELPPSHVLAAALKRHVVG